MRLRARRVAKAKPQRLARARRAAALKRPRARWLWLLLPTLVAAGLIFATLPTRYRDKAPGANPTRPATMQAAEPAASPGKAPEAAKPVEQAMLRPPTPPRTVEVRPAWLRYAVPAPASGNRPLVAVVLDDLGLDRARTAAAIRLQGPLTLSFMTYANDLGQQTEAARAAGHELFLHVPMEAVDRHADPGPHGLFAAQSRDEILDRLRWGLGRFDRFVGINNHMGSKFTSDARSMAPVMEELRDRGLVFLDSRTSPSSSGIRLAIAYGVPHAARDVFLDDDQTPSAISKQLVRLEELARRHGSAVAIGHPHDATIAVLKTWLPHLAGEGLVLVPVSAIVRRHIAEEGETPR
jgi:polysaccharide deacetylase 2 family uncharacterized protein YibQ